MARRGACARPDQADGLPRDAPRLGPDLLARRQTAFEVAVLLSGALLLAYLYVVRFCSDCGRMDRNLKHASCSRCGAALPRHGMTTLPRRTGREPRRPGRFLGRPGGGAS